MKTGLVLEGGSMRGMYTAGVLDVMMENQIQVDGAIGVSAGAVFGCNYKSGQIGRVIRYNTKYCNDPRYVSFRNLLRTGDLFGAEFCYRDIPETLDPFDNEAFRKNPMEFYVTCTNVMTGKAVYHKCESGEGKDLQWFRASASMPLVSRVVEVDGYSLLDGGIADSIPAEYFYSLGYRYNIVILTQPQGFVKQKNSYLPLLKASLWKYPFAYQAIATRHERYNAALQFVAEKEKSGEFFVFRPSHALQVGTVEHHPDRLWETYRLGREDAIKRLEEMKEFVDTCKISV